MKTPMRDILIALLIGLTVGWFAAERLSGHHPRHGKGRMIERFSRELKLSPDQKEAVGAILKNKRAQFMALKNEMKPRFEEIRESSKLEIRKVLEADQLDRFEKMEACWAERWRKKREHIHLTPTN